MSKRSLATYSIRVRKSGTKDEWLELGNFDGAGGDVLKVCYGYFSALADQHFDNSFTQQSLGAEPPEVDNRVLKVTLSSGTYGIESTFKDRDSGQDRFKREHSDVELISLHNYLVLPSKSKIGLLITERYQGNGIITTLCKSFNLAFRRRYPDYTVEINPVSPAAAINQLLIQGRLTKIRLSRHSIPSDLANAYELSDYEKDLGTIELVLRPPRSTPLTKKAIQKVLSKNGNAKSLLEFHGVTYDELRAEVQVGSSLRTLAVTSQSAPSMIYVLEESKGNVSAPPAEVVYSRAAQIVRELAPDAGILDDFLAEEFVMPDSWHGYRLEVPSP